MNIFATSILTDPSAKQYIADFNAAGSQILKDSPERTFRDWILLAENKVPFLKQTNAKIMAIAAALIHEGQWNKNVAKVYIPMVFKDKTQKQLDALLDDVAKYYVRLNT